jgi:hypothetical protein
LIIAIPEVLRDKLGPEGARALAELFNEASVRTRDDVIELAVGRFEKRLAEEIGAVRAEIGLLRGEIDSQIGTLRGDIGSQIGTLRGEIDSQIGTLRGEIDSKIGRFEGRMTRWMFVFWIGQLGALLGVLFAFFRP